MTISLALTESVSDFCDPSDFERFFSEKQRTLLRNTFDPRERPIICSPGESCKSNLFLGFFFDGTRNNYAVSEQAGDFTHSNVARLFDAYPGQTIAPAVMLTPQVKWPDEARYPNYFRVYTPGVGTPFDDTEFSKAHDGGLA